MNRAFGVFLFSFILLFTAAAQEKPGNWYFGIKGGVPFGVSTFSSFSGGNIRGAWDVGFSAGYHLSEVWSVEASAAFGQLRMGSQDCCADYFLGSDGRLYLAPVANMDTYPYPSLYSKVKTQLYSIQANFDLLRQLDMRHAGRNSRWSLQLSPVLSGLVSRATLYYKEGCDLIVQRPSQFNLGMGGELTAGYRICPQLTIGLYSKATYFPGTRIDGAPERLHENNCIWDSGLKLTWSFGKKKESISGKANLANMKGGRL